MELKHFVIQHHALATNFQVSSGRLRILTTRAMEMDDNIKGENATWLKTARLVHIFNIIYPIGEVKAEAFIILFIPLESRVKCFQVVIPICDNLR